MTDAGRKALAALAQAVDEWFNIDPAKDNWNQDTLDAWSERMKAARLAAAAALTAQSPAGVPPEPNTRDCDCPSPKIRSCKLLPNCMMTTELDTWDTPAAGVPTTEPAAPIAREPDSPARIKRLCAQAKVPKYMHDTDDGRAALVRFAQAYAAPQAPAEPVAQELVACLTAERDHWKANHDNQVQRAALLMQRPDLPVDRLPAYRDLERYQKTLQQIYNVMGPAAAPCCQGCNWEWNEAIRLAQEAMGERLVPYRAKEPK